MARILSLVRSGHLSAADPAVRRLLSGSVFPEATVASLSSAIGPLSPMGLPTASTSVPSGLEERAALLSRMRLEHQRLLLLQQRELQQQHHARLQHLQLDQDLLRGLGGSSLSSSSALMLEALRQRQARQQHRAAILGLSTRGEGNSFLQQQLLSSSTATTADPMPSAGMLGSLALAHPTPGQTPSLFQALQHQRQAGGQLRTMTSPGMAEMTASTGVAAAGPHVAESSLPESKKKSYKRREKDKPKRPLSAYNFFFKEERARILEEGKVQQAAQTTKSAVDGKTKIRKGRGRPHGKITFEDLGRLISQRWQELDPKDVDYYKKKSDEDRKRYQLEMEAYQNRKAH